MQIMGGTIHRRAAGGLEADHADLVHATVWMLLFCCVFDLTFSRVFAARPDTFRENGLMLAANMMLATSLRLPSVSPFSYGQTVAIIFGFEVYEFGRHLRRGRANVSAGSSAALLGHHGGCVLMGAVTLAAYNRLPPPEVAVWDAMWSGLAPMTTSSVFLGVRLLMPSLLADLAFTVAFLYTRLLEAPINYLDFHCAHGSFGALARLPTHPVAACCVLGVWTMLVVINFYWGALLLRKVGSKLLGQESRADPAKKEV
jgi:hypothetical protein